MDATAPGPAPVETDLSLITQLLPANTQNVLELGCGRAEIARTLAAQLPGIEFLVTDLEHPAPEVMADMNRLSNLTFKIGRAEQIEADPGAFDVVLLIKSFHHVPVSLMDRALTEVNKVLRNGGIVYISEPVYAGPYNEILRLFNDEKDCRQRAIESIELAIRSGLFQRVNQFQFDSIRRFKDFAEYEQSVMNAPHLSMRIDTAMRQRVRERIENYRRKHGNLEFRAPQQIEVLKRPNSAMVST